MVEAKAGGNKFEVKKWNAVALWAWGKKSIETLRFNKCYYRHSCR